MASTTHPRKRRRTTEPDDPTNDDGHQVCGCVRGRVLGLGLTLNPWVASSIRCSSTLTHTHLPTYDTHVRYPRMMIAGGGSQCLHRLLRLGTPTRRRGPPVANPGVAPVSPRFTREGGDPGRHPPPWSATKMPGCLETQPMVCPAPLSAFWVPTTTATTTTTPAVRATTWPTTVPTPTSIVASASRWPPISPHGCS